MSDEPWADETAELDEIIDPAGVVPSDTVDPAVAFIEIAASRTPATAAVAETALDEIDELVARYEVGAGAP